LKFFDAEFERKNIQDFTTWQIEIVKSMRKETLNPATVNWGLSVLKHSFRKAVECGKMKENPAKKVKLFKGASARVRYLMPDEIQTLLSHCEDFLRPVVTVALHTGMRRGELLDLKWAEVNCDQGTITLLDTKNYERRDIPITR